MSVLIDNITDVAMSLPQKERALLANKLILSLENGENVEVSEAWKKEISRRVEEIKNGTAKLIDSDVVFAEIDKLIDE